MSLLFAPETRLAERRDSPLNPRTVLGPLLDLQRYVKQHDYRGHDLFDGLNSALFRHTPLYRSELFRLALIQFCKRSRINWRPLLLVPADFNPKGGGLFLSGYLNLYRHEAREEYAVEAHYLYHQLRQCRIERPGGIAWGYNFDWQARAFYVPKGVPNLVTSVFIGYALLDYARTFHIVEALDLAADVARFILSDMIQFESDTRLCFNYIPNRDAQVHNANLLAAAYLAETRHLLPPEQHDDIAEKIRKAVDFSVADLRADGAWPYGTKPFHRWVDNFHTAYNLESLMRIRQALPDTDDLDAVIERVLDYHLSHLFTADGLPKYYDTKLYPIDSHVIAESILLFNRLRDFNAPIAINWPRILRIEQALMDLVHDFQAPRGYFYHQRDARGWNRIPYIRWGQAWMFLALSSCLRPSAG